MSIFQLLDQGIILSFKRSYRKLLLKRIISAQDENKMYLVDILSALHLPKATWNAATEKTDKNCFRHADFEVQSELMKSSNGMLDNQ